MMVLLVTKEYRPPCDCPRPQTIVRSRSTIACFYLEHKGKNLNNAWRRRLVSEKIFTLKKKNQFRLI